MGLCNFFYQNSLDVYGSDQNKEMLKTQLTAFTSKFSDTKQEKVNKGYLNF